MKVVQINATYGNGSTGGIVKDIQYQCLQSGIECYVAYSKSSYPKELIVKGYQVGCLLDHKIHAVLCRINGMQGYFSKLATRNFLRWLDKLHPDIINIHNLHSNFINLPMLFKWSAQHNIAVVVTLHDCWFFTGGCFHFTSSNCFRWQMECGHCPRKHLDFPSLFFDCSSKIIKDKKRLFGSIPKLSVVGVSKWIVEEASKNVFKNARCMTIHNGVDIDFFHPVSSNLKKKLNIEGKFVILAPANKWFLPINMETFKVISGLLDNDMIMLFIGVGAPKKLLMSNMIDLGYISSREELRDIYSAADVMVNCSREESLSLLNIEVQACGTPVVTYSNTGVKETVDGKSGFAVENGNPIKLWERIIQIKNAGKSTYSLSCINWVKENFDKKVNYLRYIELYKSII